MIRISADYLVKVQQAQSGADLHTLLQDALCLEHATVPPYLTAAYSLKVGANNRIRNMIIEIAVQEMLHMTIVANILNAIAGKPNFADPTMLPRYPGPLPMCIGGDLSVGLKKFSKDLVREVFMAIEQPEHPLEFPVVGLTSTYATIGQFYQAVIDKINELGNAIFTGNPARQVSGAWFPPEQLFAITDAGTAVRALQVIVREGEGTSSTPLGDAGEMAHYYRFASIEKGRMLVPDSSVPQGYSYSGQAITFVPAGVWDFPDDTKTSDYPVGTEERRRVVAFNAAYSSLLRRLDCAFDGHPETIDDIVGQMGALRSLAVAVVSRTNPATGRQCGLTFEYMPPRSPALTSLTSQAGVAFRSASGPSSPASVQKEAPVGFPYDLGDVVVFKIHPAIGIARVANNDDYYVFGIAQENYKSNKVMKRQAVQFRIFAYGENHVGLGELTPQVMKALGITAVWNAKVANRKVARLEQTPLTGNAFVVSAEASSNDANGGKLVGSLPSFAEGAAIPLGQITGSGLFIPPKGGVYRKTAGDPIRPYPALSKNHADTTCDGSVSVCLTVDGQQLDVLPACIVVAPQDFSPDTNEQFTLNDFLRVTLNLPGGTTPGTIHNETARRIDANALKPGTADFHPGFEVSFGRRSEVTNLPSVFYQAAQDPRIDPREIRVRYRSVASGTGAVPGQLTSGLCSTWQGDFTACKGYWVEHLPIEVYLDEDTSTSVSLFRRNYADIGLDVTELSSGDDFNDHVDQIGIVRLRSAKKTETERDPGDDI